MIIRKPLTYSDLNLIAMQKRGKGGWGKTRARERNGQRAKERKLFCVSFARPREEIRPNSARAPLNVGAYGDWKEREKQRD